MISLLQKPSKIVACGVVAAFLGATNMAFAQQAQGWPNANNTTPSNTPSSSTSSSSSSTAAQAQENPNANDQTQQAAPNNQQPPAGEQPQGPEPAQQGPTGTPPGPYAQPPQGRYGQQPQGAYGQPPEQGPYQAQQGPYGPGPGPYAQQQSGPYGPPPPGYGQQGPAYGPYGPNPYASAPRAVPAELTVSAGTTLVVRSNQELKADRDNPGTTFTATLVRPLIVNGVVAALPGATVTGQVVEAQDAKNVRALGKYGLVLNSVTAVDGQQVPLHAAVTAVREYHGAPGQDVGTMATTTGIGAVVGGLIGWGAGAAIGAGVGALAGAAVLVNEHAHNTIKPEELMTFNLQQPAEISTTSSPQAFHYVQPGEFAPQQRTLQPRYGYAYAPSPVIAAPYPYYYYGYGPYYPGFGFAYYGGYHHWR